MRTKRVGIMSADTRQIWQKAYQAKNTILKLIKHKPMKAKHFKKIRQLIQWYCVDRTPYMFGGFDGEGWRIRFIPPENWNRVCGYSPKDAVNRLARKTGTSADFSYSSGAYPSNEMFGKWRVLPVNNTHIRNITYWR